MTQSANNLSCDAILFDLDGVLIDSSACIIRHWQEWADRHGLDLAGIMRIAHGMRTIETMRAIAPHLDVEQEAAQFTANEVTDTEGVFAIPGAAQVLAQLTPGAWAIVTSGSKTLVHARLAAAGLPIPSVLITGDDVAHGKPDPEPYRVAARRLGIAPDRCVVIEDAPAGVESGRSAGMHVIGVATTHSSDILLAHGAQMVLARIDQLNTGALLDSTGRSGSK